MAGQTTAATAPVHTIMTANVRAVTLDMTVHEAIGLLLKYSIAGAPVIDATEKVISVVSEGDLLKLATSVGLQKKIADCLDRLCKTKDLLTLKTSDAFAYAYMKFLSNPVHRLIVVDEQGRLEGIVSRSNILRVVYESNKADY